MRRFYYFPAGGAGGGCLMVVCSMIAVWLIAIAALNAIDNRIAHVLDPSLATHETATAQASSQEIAQIVRDYYQDVEKQDYRNAYLYFHYDLTQQCFLEGQASTEQMWGNVTSFTLVSVLFQDSATSDFYIGTWAATIQEIRPQKERTMMLYFQNENGLWKIVQARPYFG
jgi:hypothetical protein